MIRIESILVPFDCAQGKIGESCNQ